MNPFPHGYLCLLLLLVAPLSQAAAEPPQTAATAQPAGAGQAAGAGPGQYDADRSLAKSQAAIGTKLEDLVFTDSSGKQVQLADFHGRPLLVSLIFTSCYHVCPAITRHLANAAEAAREALGEDSFQVLTVGFDIARDTPDAMRVFAREQKIDDPNWGFVSANRATIDALVAGVGFDYFPAPRGFDHINQVTLVDREGVVYRQVYGAAFELPALVEPLKELVFNRPVAQAHFASGLVDRIMLFCTVYDPATGRYRFDYSLFVQIAAGALAILGVGGWLVLEALRFATAQTSQQLMLAALQKPGRWLFERAGTALEAGFGSRLNPLHYLGALTIFFLWIVLVSGIWLFIFFQTSVDGAYASVERITHDQWYFGGVMRSLHRYASDAAVVTLVLHLLKEWVFDRYRSKHWFSWVTGIPLVWIIIPLGITGYWLVWDTLAQYVALTSAELLDRLPIFTDSMARNFLSATALSDRFFTLMAFLHLIGLPLFLVFAIWLHVFRISGPRINPPRELMIGTLLTLLLLSLLYPALSQGVANLAVAPQSVSLDWYYLLLYPLVKTWSAGGLWLLLGGFSALLFIAPWLPPAKAPAIAVVNLDNCNGCERCANDCPFDAINMQPRSDGKNYEQEAVVDPALCLSCGICVGACPTATPFRQATALVPGIDLPDAGMAMLRSELELAVAGLSAGNRVIAFACASSPVLRPINAAATAVITLRCMAQLPPSFIDYILSRGLADGVFLAGCKGGDCHYRLGAEWARARINRERDPYLRKRIDPGRVALGWDDAWNHHGQPAHAVEAFRLRLGLHLGLLPATNSGVQAAAIPLPAPVAPATLPLLAGARNRWRQYMPWRMPLRALAYGLFAVAASVFSAWPVFELIKPGEAVISLTFSHAGQRVEECRRLGQAELDKLPPNMRKVTDCPRERRPVAVVFQVDDAIVYRHTSPPSGMWSDGESTIYARFPVQQGEHVLHIGMNDSGREEGFDYALETRIMLRPEQHVVVEFDADRKVFVVR